MENKMSYFLNLLFMIYNNPKMFYEIPFSIEKLWLGNPGYIIIFFRFNH